MFEVPTGHAVRCMEMTFPMTSDNPLGQCKNNASVFIHGGMFDGMKLCDGCLRYYSTEGAKVYPISMRTDE